MLDHLGMPRRSVRSRQEAPTELDQRSACSLGVCSGMRVYGLNHEGREKGNGTQMCRMGEGRNGESAERPGEIGGLKKKGT